MKTTVIATLLLALASISLEAQEREPADTQFPGFLQGAVLAAGNNAPIYSARVRIGNRIGELRTDEQGLFRLSLPAGAYELRIRAMGYAPRTIPALVAYGDSTDVVVLMEPAPIRLEAIQVAPSTFGVLGDDEIVTTQVLSREEVQTQPHMGEDIYRSVDRLPGVASHDITARLRVRGAPDSHVLQLLDGVELYDAFHLKDVEGIFSIIDVETVSDVNFVTGGFTAEYGDRLAGVFSLRTPTPDPTRTSTTISLSLQNVGIRSQGGLARGRASWLVSARRGFLDILLGLTDDDSGPDAGRFSPTYYDAFGKFQLQLNSRHLLSASALRAGDRLSSVDDDDATGLESEWNSSYAWITWDAEFTNSLTARTVAYASRVTRNRRGEEFDRDTDNQTLLLSDDGGFDALGIKQDWSMAVSDRVLMRWGFDLKHGSADYDYFRSFGYWVPNTTNPLVPSFSWAADTVTVAANPAGDELGSYLTSRARLVGPLFTEVGVRFDHQSHTGDNTVSPRVNLALYLGPETALRGAWGFYYQSHGVQDMYFMDGEDSFYPAQRAEHRILGLEHRLGRETTLRLEAYERRIANPWPEYRNLEAEIEVVPEESPEDRVRFEPTRGVARGIELLVKRDRGSFVWSASYALAVAEDEIAGEWVPGPFDQRHTLHVEFGYRPNDRWSVSAAWQFHSPWPITAFEPTIGETATNQPYAIVAYGTPYGERLAPYHRLDFRVVRHVGVGRGRLSVFLDVFNLYNRANELAYENAIEVITVSGQSRLNVNRDPQTLIPILPTVGARWEF